MLGSLSLYVLDDNSQSFSLLSHREKHQYRKSALNRIWKILYRSTVIVRVTPIKIWHNNVKQRRNVVKCLVKSFTNVFQVFRSFHIFWWRFCILLIKYCSYGCRFLLFNSFFFSKQLNYYKRKFCTFLTNCSIFFSKFQLNCIFWFTCRS